LLRYCSSFTLKGDKANSTAYELSREMVDEAMHTYSVFTCQINASRKYVRALSAEQAALIMAHWYQIETGTAPKGWTRVKIAGVIYKVELTSCYVEKV
jgi:hypothetical protein